MKQLALSLLVLVYACSPKQSEKMENDTRIPLLIGTYTSEESQGIYLTKFDTVTGRMSDFELVAESENPSFLTISPKTKTVYAVNENDPGQISIFGWDEDKKLVPKNVLPSEGIHPCHISLSPNEEFLSVANYSSGNVSLYANTNDKLSLITSFQHTGKGADPERQEGPHAHFSTFSKDGKRLYAVDLGIDEIKLYDPNNTSQSITAYKAEPGEGPRHIDFHPTKDLVFIMNELNNTVAACKVLDCLLYTSPSPRD